MSFRKEEKLKVHASRILELYDWIYTHGGVELYKPRIVSSTYLDNDQMKMFLDSEEGSVPRKKIRIRSYSRSDHNNENSAFEIKTSSVEGRYKSISRAQNLNKILSIGYFDQDYGVCKPVVRITYSRSYYSIYGVRLTIDNSIEYQSISKNSHCVNRLKEPIVAVEIKADDHVPVEYLLSKFPFDRVRFSKYANAIHCITTNKVIHF